jgi:hypothetical protein
MIDISQLNDATAQRILTTIAKARSSAMPDDSHLPEALAEELSITPSSATVSAGDLARQALLVLAEDPATRHAIDSMASEEGSATRQLFFDGGTIALGFAAYFALSTALDIQRDKGGKWSFKMKVKPASEAAVRKLIEKLISYLPG